MKPTKSKLALAASTVVLGTSLVACGQENVGTSSSGDNNNPVTITFVAAEYSNNTEPYWQDLIKKFEAQNPNIKVDLQVVGWDALPQKVNTMVSTHQTPDLLNYNQYASFAADGLLNPWDKVVPQSLIDSMYPSFVQSGEMNNTLYGLPLIASVRALYYNKDLFAKAGITEPPKTWSELRNDAMKIKQKTGIPGFGIPYTNLEGQADFSYFAFGNGGGWKKDGKWDLNDPKNVEALQFMHDLTFKDKVTNPQPTAINRDEMQKVFEQGQVGMMITANFFITLIKQQAPNLHYGVAPIPVNDGVAPVTLGVADYLLSFKSSKHPDAVSKFVQFFYQNNNYEQFLKNEGMLPVTKSAGDDIKKSDPDQAPFIDLLPTAQFYPNSDPKVSKAIVAIQQAGEAVLSNQESPKQALDQAQAAVEGN